MRRQKWKPLKNVLWYFQNILITFGLLALGACLCKWKDGVRRSIKYPVERQIID